MTDKPLTGSGYPKGETNIDVVDKLIWMDTNTLDVALADLCVEARNEIERLREENKRLQAWKEARRG